MDHVLQHLGLIRSLEHPWSGDYLIIRLTRRGRHGNYVVYVVNAVFSHTGLTRSFWTNNGIRSKFSDFEHFENALKNFSDEMFQVFVIDDCKLCSSANKMQTKKLPDKLQYAFVFYDLGLWLGSVGSVSRVR